MKKNLFLFLISFISCQNDYLATIEDGVFYQEEGKMNTIDDCSKYLQFYDSITSIDNWVKYDSFEERLQACQISKECVQNLSTDVLTELLFNHPMYSTYIAYDYQFRGIEVVVENNNVYNELLKRKDASVSLLKAYEDKYNEFAVDLISSEKPKVFLVKLSFMELLIAHGDFPELYREPLCRRLEEIVVKFIELKNAHNERFSYETLKNSLLIKKRLDCNGFIYNYELWSIVKSGLYNDNPKSRVWIIPHPVVLGHGYVYTKFGKQVEYDIIEELTQDEIEGYTFSLRSQHPNATFVGNSTYSFNALGYAWHTHSHPNDSVWINKTTTNNGQNVSKYYTDDYYCNGYSSTSHYIVTYDNNSHAAVKYDNQGHYISKWGAGPLMIHTINDCPFNTSNKEYYVRRVFSGALATSYGSGFTAVEVPGSYFIPQGSLPNSNLITYSWHIEDARGEEITPTKATVNYGTTGCGITFHRTGMYEISVSVGLTDGTHLGIYSFQAIVLNQSGDFNL